MLILSGCAHLLQDLLDYLSSNKLVYSFSSFMSKLSKDISRVTCQQMVEEYWRKEPIVAKLVDFGESRSSLHQTFSICHTMTHNIDRGTIVCMTPELFKNKNECTAVSVNDSVKCDFWAYGMIRFE